MSHSQTFIGQARRFHDGGPIRPSGSSWRWTGECAGDSGPGCSRSYRREFLRLEHGIEIVGWVSEVAGVRAPVDIDQLTVENVDQSPIRCPDTETSARFEAEIARARDEGESLGGWVGVVARGVPAGWGIRSLEK